MKSNATKLYLRFIDRCIGIECAGGVATDLLRSNFEGMLTHGGPCDLTYVIDETTDGQFILRRSDCEFEVTASHSGELIYELEGNLVVWLQLEHQSYAFLHAAALVRNQSIHLLSGRSGAGKSTTAFGLSHYGFGLATDEMVALNLTTGELTPFRHAVCLKKAPPEAFELPYGTITSGRGFHIPPSALGETTAVAGLTVSSIFFVEHDPALSAPAIQQCGAGEAMTRLYPNMMNALAHQNDGLAAAGTIVRDARTYVVGTAELGASCELIRQTVDEQLPNQPPPG